MKSSLLPQILKLEEHFTQYERLGGGKLTGDMKSAILLRSVGGQMKTHLNITLNEGSSYNKNQMERVSRLVLFECEPNPFNYRWSSSDGSR